MYLFLVCFSQTNIYEKARKYTTIFFILQIIRPIKTLFYFSGVRFSIINFDLRSSLLTLGIINKFLLLSLNRSLQLSIIKGREVDGRLKPSNLPSFNPDNHRLSIPVFVIWDVKSELDLSL